MRRPALLITALIILVVLIVWSFMPPADQSIIRLKDRKAIGFKSMLSDLKKADIVFIGEDHDNILHHQSELRIISALHESDVPVAVGLEMFRSRSQPMLDLWTSGRLKEDDLINIYVANWHTPWPLYKDIFIYLREHQIPMIGLNISKALSEKVYREGFDALSPAEKKELPPGIVCSLDPEYMDIIRKVYGTHGGSDRRFIHFCEAQMVWDKSMAWTLAEYKKMNPGLKIIVLTGRVHAWKFGIPKHLKEKTDYSFRVVLPGPPISTGPMSVDPAEADYLLR